MVYDRREKGRRKKEIEGVRKQCQGGRDVKRDRRR